MRGLKGMGRKRREGGRVVQPSWKGKGARNSPGNARIWQHGDACASERDQGEEATRDALKTSCCISALLSSARLMASPESPRLRSSTSSEKYLAPNS